MSERHAGGCLCGQVRYVVKGPISDVSYCHCAMCRRFHGHAGAFVGALRTDFAFVGTGRPSWYASSDKARRGFCPTCGSALFWDAPDESRTYFTAGSLDEPTGLTGRRHIFAADKSDYYAIDDDLPTYPGAAGG